jgi:hypothetical protein
MELIIYIVIKRLIMKKKIIYWSLMVILLILFLVYDKLGSIGILLGYFVGLAMGITNPPPKNVL